MEKKIYQTTDRKRWALLVICGQQIFGMKMRDEPSKCQAISFVKTQYMA